MLFNVAQLLKEPTGSVRHFNLTEAINGLDPELHVLGPLVGEVTLLRTNAGIMAFGELSTALQVMCNRCLAPIATQVRFHLEEVFHPSHEVFTGRALRPDEYDGALEDLEDDALLIDEKHILDLTEVVRQNLWLALPMYPGCNWTGAGECPNRARVQSDLGVRILRADEPALEPGAIDPRWAALAELEEADSPQATAAGPAATDEAAG